MNLNELESVTEQVVTLLEADEWTLDKLSTATVNELVAYKGIGKITAERIIEEAASLLNKKGLEDADRLAKEYYYQKTPPSKIALDWEKEGLSVTELALTSVRALVALKGIDESLAIQIISAAQDILNERKLYESHLTIPGSNPKVTSAAFPVEWLSGAVAPPPMAVRVKRVFDEAVSAYARANG